ncbi:VWA domain-containing protein [Rhodovulum sp. 12E13]|uniref:vWA domain-containing protein n=1 Tax=Rhodovulum sp. 12E13 TaxID=2203891 RepID=UPI000E185589|nr:VWA domain-containing protein [Rhodovulum sp. 12E13]RDC72737.1 VWA domain-containing protein [Rhodovulum sp. 12E13]
MSRVTRFAGRDPGPSARVAGFLGHCRENGLRLGVSETETALRALASVEAADPAQARAALKAVCCGSADEARRFDALFEAFWMNGGRVVTRATPSVRTPTRAMRSTAEATGPQAEGAGQQDSPDGEGEGEAEGGGEGRLLAVRSQSIARRDLRELVSRDDIAEAERVAERLGRALRDRRSRRRRAAKRGAEIDFRRLVRRSLAIGGEPLHLPRKARPDRPVRIAALADVSGSMTVYARPFLAFLAGLMRGDPSADAYLFHTRLVRITEALRDPDPLRALNRMSLLAEGFGGGSRIGACLERFARGYAPAFVDGRTVVFILSDGYDSEGKGAIGPALARLGRRGCRIVWLNPLKGWADHGAIAAGMAEARPHLDAVHSVNTLAGLAALEGELARL